MAIDYFNASLKLPLIDRNAKTPQEFVDYLVRLVGALQEDIILGLGTITNWQLGMTNVGVWYSQVPDTNGVYADGCWRLIQIDDAIELQKKVSGSWKKVALWDY